MFKLRYYIVAFIVFFSYLAKGQSDVERRVDIHKKDWELFLVRKYVSPRLSIILKHKEEMYLTVGFVDKGSLEKKARLIVTLTKQAKDLNKELVYKYEVKNTEERIKLYNLLEGVFIRTVIDKTTDIINSVRYDVEYREIKSWEEKLRILKEFGESLRMIKNVLDQEK